MKIYKIAGIMFLLAISASHIANIKSLKSLFAKTEDYVIYSGGQEPTFHDVQFVNWQNINSFYK